MVRTKKYGQNAMLTKCYKELIGAQKIWDKLKRLIYRKVTLNKLKSIIVKRNCDLYSMDYDNYN